MARIDFSKREVTWSIGYFGPPGSGKASNLARLRAVAIPDEPASDLQQFLEREWLYMEGLDLGVSPVKGFAARFTLFATRAEAPEQAARTTLLQDPDGLVFVADSDAGRMEANAAFMTAWMQALRGAGAGPEELAMVLQWNKRDLAAAVPARELGQRLNGGGWQEVEASAGDGTGVVSCFQLVAELLRKRFELELAP